MARALLATLAGGWLVLAGCSGGGPEGPPPQAAAPGSGLATPSAGATAPHSAAGEAEGKAAPKKVPAAGPGRRHPFAPVVDPEARRASLTTEAGPLELKGVLQSDVRVALIQEGQKVHSVRVGEHVGGLTVLEIRETEVVLGAGARKRILPLYAP